MHWMQMISGEPIKEADHDDEDYQRDYLVFVYWEYDYDYYAPVFHPDLTVNMNINSEAF